MPVASSTRQNGILLVLLLFAQLLMMTGSARSSDGTTRLESLFMGASAPIVRVADGASGFVAGSARGLRQLFNVHARNAALRLEVRRMRSEVEHLREAELQNDRLRRLLEMREVLAPRSVGATVITAVDTEQTRMIVIDRGLDDGVQVDQAVVAWGGAVGRVFAVESDHAKVRLLTDPNSGVAGIVQRSRVQGMVFREGDAPLGLHYVPRFSDVLLGDRVVTSGLDGIFPRGLGVGTVVYLRETPDGGQQILLEPEVDFRTVEEVLVLLEPVGGRLLTLGAGMDG